MLVRFEEEDGRLLAVVDPLAIGHGELEEYARKLIAETLKERSRKGLSTGLPLEGELLEDEKRANTR
jgi:hypothetical protein